MTKEQLLGAVKEAMQLHNLAFAGAEISEATGVVRVTVDTWSNAGKGLTTGERERLELARTWLVERLPSGTAVEFVEAASPILRLDELGFDASMAQFLGDCHKHVPGCKCAVGFKPDEQCADCRESEPRDSYCVCGPVEKVFES